MVMCKIKSGVTRTACSSGSAGATTEFALANEGGAKADKKAVGGLVISRGCAHDKATDLQPQRSCLFSPITFSCYKRSRLLMDDNSTGATEAKKQLLTVFGRGFGGTLFP